MVWMRYWYEGFDAVLVLKRYCWMCMWDCCAVDAVLLWCECRTRASTVWCEVDTLLV